MSALVTNNAWGTLSVPISATAVTILLSTGQGERFPQVSGGTHWFYATLVDADNNLEIVKCTERRSDTLTVERGVDSTTPHAYVAGDRLELRPCAALLNDKATQLDLDNLSRRLDDEVDHLTEAINQTGDASLARAGGTMTGGISWQPDGYKFSVSPSNKSFEVGWNLSSKHGAGISFRRADYASNPAGGFDLWARSASAECHLIGRPDGGLTWNGNTVLTTGGGMTFTGTVSFANNTWYKFGDDYSFGDHNISGHACVRGDNANPGIAFFSSSNVEYGRITSASGVMTCSVKFRATSLQATSDARHKRDLFANFWDLRSIHGYSYDLIDDGKRHVGLIAQEVEKVIPEAVDEIDGVKCLDYNAVVAALVNVVNDLTKRVIALEVERAL